MCNSDTFPSWSQRLLCVHYFLGRTILKSGSKISVEQSRQQASSVFFALTELGLLQAWIYNNPLLLGQHTRLPTLITFCVEAPYLCCDVLASYTCFFFRFQYTWPYQCLLCLQTRFRQLYFFYSYHDPNGFHHINFLNLIVNNQLYNSLVVRNEFMVDQKKSQDFGKHQDGNRRASNALLGNPSVYFVVSDLILVMVCVDNFFDE